LAHEDLKLTQYNGPLYDNTPITSLDGLDHF